jgi:4-amino-4-deoxy-L-arabinose transferase-like glycosyltransferase
VTSGDIASPSGRLPLRPELSTRFAPATASAALLFLIVAFLTRAAVLGDPVVHIDEQFYLLVGDRMLHGMLPYVDLYDRKPIGLFLIYAGIRLLGGDGVIQYQIVAMLSAATTALIVYRIACRVAPPAGALTAGIAYLLYTLAFNGVGGQSPIFYNSVMAGAALLAMGVVTRPNQRHLTAAGAAIMMLVGMAIQIKYSVVFEGLFLGLSLLWRSWRDGRTPAKLVLQGLLWVGCALAPTALALWVYYAAGHLDAFVFANFESIFGRHEPRSMVFGRLLRTVLVLAPFWIILLKGLRSTSRPITPDWRFLQLWACAAVGGFLIFGSYYDHYALPLLVPLAALVSPWLAGEEALTGAGHGLLGFGLVSGAAIVLSFVHLEGNRAPFETMNALVKAHLNGGCLEVYEGPPALYRTAGACFVTRYVFPGFLNNAKEVTSLSGANTKEMATLLERRPTVIVMNEKPRPMISNLATRHLLEATVQRDYRLIGRLPLGTSTYLIFQRDGPPGTGSHA